MHGRIPNLAVDETIGSVGKPLIWEKWLLHGLLLVHVLPEIENIADLPELLRLTVCSGFGYEKYAEFTTFAANFSCATHSVSRFSAAFCIECA